MAQEEIKIVNVKFRGIDNWNRPVFKDLDTRSHYGSTDRLYADVEIPEAIEYFRVNPSELEYFGEHFGCEPHGGIAENIRLNIID